MRIAPPVGGHLWAMFFNCGILGLAAARGRGPVFSNCRGAAGSARQAGYAGLGAASTGWDSERRAAEFDRSVRPSRLLLVVGILAAGLCAAWPFRQNAPPPHPPVKAALPLEVPLRRSDAPLDLMPHSDVSPAIDLAEVSHRVPDEVREPPTASEPLTPAAPLPIDWTHLASPPALPASFQPAEGPPPPMSNWRPAAPTALRATAPRVRPRPYRLRDGDTLERLAERFLGSPERADEIFQMNRAVLARPDLLPVGANILIPPRAVVDDLEPGANVQER
jgi:nucleoid-associated protein YgaU